MSSQQPFKSAWSYCTNKWSEIKEYIKAGIAGILAITIISSVFSFLINVESINVMPDANEMFIKDHWYSWSVKGGISCVPNVYDIFGIAADSDYSYCNSVTYEMYNTLLSDHDEWRCELYTDYSDKPFFESFIFTFPSFKIYFIILVTSVLFYGIFSVIHDWTLVKYKKRLDDISFLPDHQADDFPFRCIWSNIWLHILAHIPSVQNSSDCDFCLCKILYSFIGILLMMIFLILDLLYISIIWPIIAMIQSSCCNKQQTHKIPTISYISAQWVGISCFMMGVATSMQMLFISTGFPFEIPSLNPSKCACSCNYIFDEYDYYKLLFITLIFIVLTMNFLYSWTMEAFDDDNYFLYLIKYILPIKQAHKTNPEEATGSMMINPNIDITEEEKQPFIKITEEEKQPFINITEEEKSMNGSADEPVDKLVDDLVDAQGKLISCILRAFIFCTDAAYLFWVIGFILLNEIVDNFYHYPKWGRIIGYIVCGIIFLSGVLILLGLMMHFLKLKAPRSEKCIEEWIWTEANENDNDNVDEELLSNQ